MINPNSNLPVFLGAATLAAGNGGIARVARMSARAIAERGHPLMMASFLDKKPENFGTWSSAPSHNSKAGFAARCHLAALRCGEAIYDSAGIARGAPRLPGLNRPYAVWMHGIEVWEALRPASAQALRNADLVLVNSHFTLQRFQALHGPLPTAKVCWLATEEDDAPPPAGPKSHPPTALILGRLVQSENYKGHSELIAAWPRVVAAIPDARLVIAGSGTGLPEVKAQALASPAAANIDLLGFVPEERLPELWRGCDLFAMPSRREGFGLVYIEAMRFGIPVIASVHDAAPEVNIDGETGFNVSLDDQAALPERLIQILANRGLAASMGAAGYRRWHEHFRYSAFQSRFNTLFDAFLTQARQSKRGIAP